MRKQSSIDKKELQKKTSSGLKQKTAACFFSYFLI